jgi:hypothetical protein
MEHKAQDVDVELLAAQEALAAAQKRKAAAEENARVAAAAALAKNLADEEMRLAKLRQEAQEANARALARKKAAEEAARSEQAARAAETHRLAQELEAREQAAREESARVERIRKVQEAAHQAELDAQSIEASLKQAQTPREEVKPVTLHEATHPLSMIFAPNAEKTEPIREISYEEQVRNQTQKDRAAESAVWKPVKHGHGNNFVNSGTSYLLEKEIKRQTGIQANTQRLDLLSSEWDEADLMKALGVVVASFSEHPTSHDGLLASIESILEAAKC